MSSDVLLEEFEVLESIYPEELSKISERDIRIAVEPDEDVEGVDPLKLALNVHYADDYPDALPDLSIDTTEGDLAEDEIEGLMSGMKSVGKENLGMAMTFTLVTYLREQILELVKSRIERRKQEEREKERLAIEAEEARTRGTPVTPESFRAWKAKFDKELAEKKAREEEDRLKALSPKEREEYKKSVFRLTGRQLFERDKNLDTLDDKLVEEGAVSVDISQYERSTSREEEDDDHRVSFSDSE